MKKQVIMISEPLNVQMIFHDIEFATELQGQDRKCYTIVK